MTLMQAFSVYPVLESICMNFEFQDLINLMKSCKKANTVIESILLRRDIDKYLMKYIPNPYAFRELLDKTGSIVCGGIIDYYRSIDKVHDMGVLHLYACFIYPTASYYTSTRAELVDIDKIDRFLTGIGAVEVPVLERVNPYYKSYLLNGLSIIVTPWHWNLLTEMISNKSSAVLTSVGTYVIYHDRSQKLAETNDMYSNANMFSNGLERVRMKFVIDNTFQVAIASRHCLLNKAKKHNENTIVGHCIARLTL